MDNAKTKNHRCVNLILSFFFLFLTACQNIRSDLNSSIAATNTIAPVDKPHLPTLDSHELPTGYIVSETFLSEDDVDGHTAVCVNISHTLPAVGWVGEICFWEDQRDSDSPGERLDYYIHGNEDKQIPDAPVIGEVSRLYTGTDKELEKPYYNGEFVVSKWIGSFHFVIPEMENAPIETVQKISNAIIHQIIISPNNIASEPINSEEPPPEPTLTSMPMVETIIPGSYLEIGFPDYIASNPNGTFKSQLVPDTLVNGFLYRTDYLAPYYVLTINPTLNNIFSIKIDFTITESVDTPTGLNYFIGTVDPSLTYPLAKYELSESPEDTIIPNLIYIEGLWEDMSRYLIEEALLGSDTHYTFEIPYEQFFSGRSKLVLRFLPEVSFKNLTFSVVGSNVDIDSLTTLPSSSDLIPNLSIHDPEDLHQHNYAFLFVQNCFVNPESDELSRLLNGSENFHSPEFVFSSDALHLHKRNAAWVVPANSIDSLAETSNYFVVNPDTFPNILSAMNRLVHTPESETLKPFWTFLEQNLLDPDLQLVTGLWVYENGSQKILPERKTTANLGILDALMVNNGDEVSFNDESLEELFVKLAEGISQNEIIAIDGKYYYAPLGLNADGTFTITTRTMGYGAVVMMTHNYFTEKNLDVTLVDKMLRGYANTLSLMVEAQEATPSNLIPETITVNLAADENGQFTYHGNFDVGDGYLFAATQKSTHMGGNWIKMSTGLPTWLVDIRGAIYAPGNSPEEKWNNYETSMRRLDAGYRLFADNFRSLYHIYNFLYQDGQYIGSYSLDGQPINLPDGILSSRLTPGEAAGYLMLGHFFNDQKMIEESRYLMAESVEELSQYYQNKLAVFNDVEDLQNAQDMQNLFWENQETAFGRNHLNEITQMFLALFQYQSGDNIVPFGTDMYSYWEHGDIDFLLETVRRENEIYFGAP